METKNGTMRVAACLLAAFFCVRPGLLFGQDLVAQYRASAERNYVLKDYEKAFDHVNFVLRAYVNKEAPEDVKNLGEKIYFAYLGEINQKEAWAKLPKVRDSLLKYPSAGSNRVQSLLKQGEARVREIEEAEKKKQEEARLAQEEAKRRAEAEKAIQEEKRREAEREAARQKEREEYLAKEKALLEEKAKLEAKQKAELDKVIEDLRKREAEREAQRERERQDALRREEAIRAEREAQLERERQASLKREESIRAEQAAQRERERQEAQRREEQIRKDREAQEARLQAELGRIAETASKGKPQDSSSGLQLGIFLIAGLGIFGILFIAALVVFVVLMLRHNKSQQEQFQATVNTLHTMSASAGLAPPQHAALPLPMMAPDGMSAGSPLQLEDKTAEAARQTPQTRLGGLLEKCAAYAVEIDRVTGRKNASRNVAELVYKVSRAKGFSEFDSLLYFGAALVYDIGFLSQDEALLRADHISDDQFEQLKNHTRTGANMVFFVEEEFRPVFVDAVKKHHENLDGSGYPAGLKDPDIPYIARVIRVAESYVALISKRDYKQILDKNSAMQELYAGKGLYDMDIVKTLDGIL